MDSRKVSPPSLRGAGHRALLIAALIVAVLPATANAASFHFTAPDPVTIEQGSTGTAALALTADGALSCSTGYEDPPATLTFDSIYALDAGGAITSSDPMTLEFRSDRDSRGGSANCAPTWDGAPDPLTVSVQVSVDAAAPLGEHTIRIEPDLANSPSTGSAGKLGGSPVQVTIVVVPAPPVFVPEPVLPEPEQVVLGEQIAPLRPDLGKSVVLSRVSGVVLFRVPGGRVVTLGDDVEVPVGSAVDATRGVVKVIVESDPTGTLQSADAWGGAFIATQGRGSAPLTVFKLAGVLKASRSRAGKAGVARASARARRKLWVKGKGRFSSRGRRASAIVRGTEWLVEETTAGTRVSVRTGVVRVRDFVLKRNLLLRAGRSYLARERRARARRAPAFTGRAR